MVGIRPEADDLLADVLESLCRRSDAFQLDLLAHEQTGDRKLFFYVRKALRLEALAYKATKHRITYPIDLCRFLSDEPQPDREVSDKLFAAFREVEARLRADDFIDAGPQYGGNGSLCRYVTRRTGKYGFYPTIKYQVTLPDGSRRLFCCRSSAIAFLTGQNPPP